MFCTKCGTAIADGAMFCGTCGMALQANSGTTGQLANPPDLSPQVRPWVRYWARMFDIYLLCIVAGLLIGIVSPEAFDRKGSDQLFALGTIFAWVFIESFLLSTAGTTPGKWLFKTQLVPPSGTAPSYSAALSRSLKVWWRGMGIGFPLASLITLIAARGNLARNGVTSWDKDDGFTVVHHRIGPLRIFVAIMFFSGFLLLMIIGTAANA